MHRRSLETVALGRAAECVKGSSSLDSWKNSQVSGQLAASEAAETETPIWQPATLPRVPEY